MTNKDDILERIKKQYNDKPITEVEQSIKGIGATIAESEESRLYLLFYLEKTNRFRENPSYKKSTFEQYILDLFNMRARTYYELLRAYISFPEESRAFGAGLVRAVINKCGSENTKTALDAIKTEQSKLKTPIKREKTDAIIQRFKRPVPVRPEPVDWQGKYITLKKDYDDLVKVVEKKDAQIEKLKARIHEIESQAGGSLAAIASQIRKAEQVGLIGTH